MSLNPGDLWGLALQVPVVGIFIWFTFRMIGIFQAAADKRDEAYLAALERIAEKIDCQDRSIQELAGLVRPAGRVRKNETTR